MKTQMHRFRKKAWAFTAIAACSLLFATSCQKYEELNPTPEELDTINAHSIDYALQVIPDIHEVIPMDLLEAMNAVHDTINGVPTVICALHFGDNPPSLVFKQNDSLLGFMKDVFIVKEYLPIDPNCGYRLSCYPGKHLLPINCFRFHDQHRGIAQVDYKYNYIKPEQEGLNNYAYELAIVSDSVFIMGEGNDFTVYYSQTRSFKASQNNDNPNYMRPSEYVVLSGTVTNGGISNLYFGTKIREYGNPDPILIGDRYQNVNDILVIHKDFVPFQYWDPNQSLTN
jgi:hypothetical protein